MKRPESMTLGQLIESLERCSSKIVRIAAPMVIIPDPNGIYSYRGYYEDLAIGYELGDKGAKDVSPATLAGRLDSAVGASFCGYKGGAYVMRRDTIVWISNYGEVSYSRVLDVIEEDETAYIMLKMGWQK